MIEPVSCPIADRLDHVALLILPFRGVGQKYPKSNSTKEGSIAPLSISSNQERIQQRSQRIADYDQTNGLDRFVEVGLEFLELNIENTFSKFDSYTLGEILNKDKYLKFADLCQKRYSHYMEIKLGVFLGMLKEQEDSFYKQFLNDYGDSTYCKFRIVDKYFLEHKGIYVFKNNGQIKYIGRVKGEYNFYQRINLGYANISPKNCYIDGQSTNCHVNSIINSYKGDINLLFLPLESDEEIIKTERWLIDLVKPDWNISLNLSPVSKLSKACYPKGFSPKFSVNFLAKKSVLNP